MSKEQEGDNKPSIFERLAAIFPHECVEWRAGQVQKDGQRAKALAYIDARGVMTRLDEVVGPTNWQNRFSYQGNRTFCELGIRVDGEWLWKADVSEDSNFEAAKGGASGSLKRAAVLWGIGRYLYDVEAPWADCQSYKDSKGKWQVTGWTDAGERVLQAALAKAPGARFTEKPESVQMMLDLIGKAKTVEELETIRKQHWPAIALEYRAEVLRAGTTRKRELEKAPPPPDAGERPARQSRPPRQR